MREKTNPTNHRTPAFTLVELMIVIGIIAILAAIAIPNLLQAMLSSNETVTVANLRRLSGSQVNFKRNDWYRVGGLSYAVGATHLYEFTSWDGQLKEPRLIDLSFSQAFGTDLKGAGAIAKAGYIFHDITSTASTTPLSGGSPMISDFAYAAVPENYGTTGRVTYVMNKSCVVYMQDIAGSSVATFPDPLTSWTVVSD